MLEAERIEYGRVAGEGRLMSVEVSNPKRAASRVAARSAFAKRIALSLASLPRPSTLGELLSHLRGIDLPQLRGSFRVRVYKISGSPPANSIEIERELGRIILDNVENLKVNLTEPDYEFMVIFTGGGVKLALLLDSVDRSDLVARSVSMRPFRHPSSMNPFLARAMLNLARVRPGDLVLDPFVGAGGIALEALFLGARLIGFDVDPKMIRGAEINLTSYSFFSGYKLAVADVRDLNLDVVPDEVVTDPPYGRSTKIVGSSPRELISAMLERARESLRPGGHIVFSAPVEMRPSEMAASRGLMVREKHLIRIHRGLTREIVVGVNPP